MERMGQYLRKVVPLSESISQFGYKVNNYFQLKDKVWNGPDVEKFFVGNLITGITRKGKYLLFYTKKGMFVAHQRFTGWWEDPSQPEYLKYMETGDAPGLHQKSITAGFGWPSGKRLLFHDSRSLAKLSIHPGINEPKQLDYLASQGPDVLFDQCTDPAWLNFPYDFKWFDRCFQREVEKHPHMEVKLWLLDQKQHAGVGNIMACESLHRAHIHPARALDSLLSDEVNVLFDSVVMVAKEAQKAKCEYDEYIRVFRRKECASCKGPVVRISQANRGSYLCPRCQVPDVAPLPEEVEDVRSETAAET